MGMSGWKVRRDGGKIGRRDRWKMGGGGKGRMRRGCLKVRSRRWGLRRDGCGGIVIEVGTEPVSVNHYDSLHRHVTLQVT